MRGLRRRTAEERSRRKFSRRQWRRRFLAWKPIVAALLVIALVATAIWYVLFSSHLAADKVEVTGAALLTDSQVIKAARVPLGEPLATMDLGSIQRRVEGLAPVRSVKVSRQWPHTILIAVTERTAIAVVRLGTQLKGMDATGTLFRGYPRKPANLPLVEMPAGTSSAALAEAGKVIAAMPADLAGRVDHLTVASVDEINLTLRSGAIVHWGSADQSAQKATVLMVLLRQNAKTYDVSVPGQPLTTG